MSTTSPRKRKKGLEITRPGYCVFCGTDEKNEETYGKSIKAQGMTVHYFCMLFSSGLCQRGRTEKDGILGFIAKDIHKEVNRGKKLSCCYCKQKGATVGCIVKTCRLSFHLGCGRTNGTMHQFYGSFSSYCPSHRPRQMASTSDRLAFYGTANTTCAICICAVEARSSNDTLRSPCCRNSWFHRNCIQKLASTAGLYYFKCPLCNNKEVFQEEMLEFGIYIPDQDAAWEMDPNAYQDLLERYNRCDVTTCRCPRGREYNKDDSKWEIVLCILCGSQGCHIRCQGLKSHNEEWICKDCKEIEKKVSGKSPKGRNNKQSKNSASKIKEELRKEYEKLQEKACNPNAGANSAGSSPSVASPQSSGEGTSRNRASTPRRPPRVRNFSESVVHLNSQEIDDEIDVDVDGSDAEGSTTPPDKISETTPGSRTPRGDDRFRTATRTPSRNNTVRNNHRSQSTNTTPTSNTQTHGRIPTTPRSNSRPHSAHRRTPRHTPRATDGITRHDRHRHRSANPTPQRRGRSQSPSHGSRSTQNEECASTSSTSRSNPSSPGVWSPATMGPKGSRLLRRLITDLGPPCSPVSASCTAVGSLQRLSVCVTPCPVPRGISVSLQDTEWKQRSRKRKRRSPWSHGIIRRPSSSKMRRHPSTNDKNSSNKIAEVSTDTASSELDHNGESSDDQQSREKTRSTRSKTNPSDLVSLEDFPRTFDRVKMPGKSPHCSTNTTGELSERSTTSNTTGELSERSTTSKSTSKRLRLSTEKKQELAKVDSMSKRCLDYNSNNSLRVEEKDEGYDWFIEPDNTEVAYSTDVTDSDEEHSAYSKLIQIQKRCSPSSSTSLSESITDVPEPPRVVIPEFVDMDSVYLDRDIGFGTGTSSITVGDDEQPQKNDNDLAAPTKNTSDEDILFLDDASLASADSEEIIFVRAERPPTHTHNGLNRQWVNEGHPILIDLTQCGTEDAPICLNDTLPDNDSTSVMTCNGFYGTPPIMMPNEENPSISDLNLMQSLYTENSSPSSWAYPSPSSQFQLGNNNNNRLSLTRKRPSDAPS